MKLSEKIKSRTSEDKRSTKKPSKKASGNKKLITRIILSVLCVCVIFGCIALIAGMIFYTVSMSGDKYAMDLDVEKLEYTTIMYGIDPETGADVEINKLYNPDANRIWVDFDQMPQVLKDTITAVEDKRFEKHNGVDWFRTLTSGINYALQKIGLPGLYRGTPGASTITQQLVRNLTNDKDVNSSRKLREIFRALKLEQKYSKDEILEAYLNTVTFSNETYGIQAAANFYFDKDVSELTAAECASIVGITKDPTQFNPHINYENNQERKEVILGMMHDQGKLTDEEYAEALAEEIVFDKNNNIARIQGQTSYFEDYVIDCVTNEMAELYEMTYKEALHELRTGGYRIYTTEDVRIQGILDEVYVNWEEYFPAVYNEEYPESAFIISDVNGRLVGMVGGKGEKQGSLVWNRATDSKRQIGSTVKPISSYALAIDSDLIHFSSMIEDKAVEINPGGGQDLWTPKNYYTGFKGYMTVCEALQRSCNMVPVQLTQMLTPRALWNFMRYTLNIDSLVENDIAYSPMALGSLSYGVTPIKMLEAYQMYSNGGTRTEPYCYTRVLDSQGNVILEKNPTPVRVLSQETATVMNRLLQQVVYGAYGTGGAARLSSGIPQGGKTGTTDDDVDQWFIGFTPYYVGVCWLGYDDQYKTTTDADGNKVFVYDAKGEKIPNTIVYQNYPPPIIWRKIMNMVHEGLEYKDFPHSKDVVKVSYCCLTGYAATDECEETAIGYYKPTNIPPACPVHGGSGYADVPLLYEKTEPDPEEEDEDSHSKKDKDDESSEESDE